MLFIDASGLHFKLIKKNSNIMLQINKLWYTQLNTNITIIIQKTNYYN